MDTECSERVSNPISIVDRERSLGVMYSVLIVNARDSRYSALFTCALLNWMVFLISGVAYGQIRKPI